MTFAWDAKKAARNLNKHDVDFREAATVFDDPNESSMKKTDRTEDELRPEYDFATMKGGVRGKYFRRILEEGTNIVLLDPEVADAFPSEASVNEALRGILNITRAVRRSGGLPKTLQPTSRAKPKAKRKRRAGTARG